MKSTDTYNDIKEVNLAYLMLAQNMVRSDREGAIFRLGISGEIADVLARWPTTSAIAAWVPCMRRFLQPASPWQRWPESHRYPAS